MDLIEGLLVPLRLPTGWVVRLNNWFYREALLPNGEENPLFVHDVTLFKLSRFEAEYHPHPHFGRDFHLDLYWQGSPKTGTYILRFYEDEDESNILASFASSRAAHIQSKINEWLDLWSIEEFPSPYKSNH